MNSVSSPPCVSISVAVRGGGGGGRAAVYGGIDAVKPVSQYADGVEAVGEGFPVGVNVNAVGQSAHNQRVGQQSAELLHKPLAERFAVIGGVAGTHDAQDMAAVQVGRAFVEQHEWGVGTFAEAGRVGLVVFGQALNLVLLCKRQFGFADAEYFGMLEGGGYLGRQAGDEGWQFAGMLKKHGGTSGSLNQVAGAYQTDAGQKGQGQTAEKFFFVHFR